MLNFMLTKYRKFFKIKYKKKSEEEKLDFFSKPLKTRFEQFLLLYDRHVVLLRCKVKVLGDVITANFQSSYSKVLATSKLIPRM